MRSRVVALCTSGLVAGATLTLGLPGRAGSATVGASASPRPSASPTASPVPSATPSVASDTTTVIASPFPAGGPAGSNLGPLLDVAPADALAAPSPSPTPSPTPLPSASAASTPPAKLAPTHQPNIPELLADPSVRATLKAPIKELAQLRWMQGVWRAKAVAEYGDGSLHTLPATTYVFSPIMKGRWYFGADGRATDYLYITFDPFRQRWVAQRFGSAPSYGVWESEYGWDGNHIDFTTTASYANGRPYARRMTILRKDARSFGIYDEEQLPTGTWKPDDAYEFAKQ